MAATAVAASMDPTEQWREPLGSCLLEHRWERQTGAGVPVAGLRLCVLGAGALELRPRPLEGLSLLRAQWPPGAPQGLWPGACVADVAAEDYWDTQGTPWEEDSQVAIWDLRRMGGRSSGSSSPSVKRIRPTCLSSSATDEVAAITNLPSRPQSTAEVDAEIVLAGGVRKAPRLVGPTEDARAASAAIATSDTGSASTKCRRLGAAAGVGGAAADASAVTIGAKRRRTGIWHVGVVSRPGEVRGPGTQRTGSMAFPLSLELPLWAHTSAPPAVAQTTVAALRPPAGGRRPLEPTPVPTAVAETRKRFLPGEGRPACRKRPRRAPRPAGVQRRGVEAARCAGARGGGG
eukprot:CAMPEP_0175729858 /NCGR_PEP_ID=MMETSP0097-20121207/50019_1 /TAXON_ID=311494 /ORGANISM="Alexandrium monilatum, Strain CCMP3105" /LENGTH=346 /DNA_ID=CAMNT_0017037731 /DNA_START=1 /DNA_END=1041 /DNA_ORIENTATION=-